MPQTEILNQLAYGNPGDFFDNSPRRALSYIIESADPLNNVFARVFTHTTGQEDLVEAGGTGVFAGFLVNNKEHVLEGAATGTLDPRNYLKNGTVASMCKMGTIYAKIPAPAVVGETVLYLEADGSLKTVAPGTALLAGEKFANAVVERFIASELDPIDGLYLAVITITDAPLRSV